MTAFNLQSNPTDESTSITLGPIHRIFFGTIRNKIILPFLLVTLTVATLGSYVVTRLVASNAQDRLTNQLLELSRATNDSIVNWEQRHLDTLRLAAFTVGIPEAMREGNQDDLTVALRAMALNQNAYLLFAVDKNGFVMADASRVNTGYETGRMAGMNLISLKSIEQVLSHTEDATGDKFTEITDLDGTLYFLTSAPVFSDSGELVGALTIGTPAATMLSEIKQNVLADLVMYRAGGEAVSTTFVLAGESDIHALNIEPAFYQLAFANPDQVTRIGEMVVNDRNYQIAYTPLQIRGETIGLIGVAYPTTLITSLITTNRGGMTILFSLITGLVVLLGYGIAANLSAPIRKLALTAEKVRAGKLDEQSQVRTSDEIGVLGRVFDDMTLRLSQQTVMLKRLYKEQEREAAYLAAVIASNADGTFVLAQDGSISRFNPVASEIMKNDEESWLKVFADLMNELVESDVAKKRVQIGSAWYDATAAQIATTQDEAAGFIVTAHDVTEQVLTDQMRTSFILQMSHELYTPLAALKGCTEVAYSTLDNKASMTGQLLLPAMENAKTLEQMITQMLDVAQMIRGGFEINRKPVELAPIVEQAVAAHHALANTQQVQLHQQIDQVEVISVDAARLQWAIEQLVKNAIQYSQPDDEIEITVTRHEGEAQLCIRDTGVGISTQDLGHLFEPFYRGCPITKNGTMLDVRGTGLGLFIAKQVIDAHEGKLMARSEPGLGSEFMIRLPLAAGEISQGTEESWHGIESS